MAATAQAVQDKVSRLFAKASSDVNSLYAQARRTRKSLGELRDELERYGIDVKYDISIPSQPGGTDD